MDRVRQRAEAMVARSACATPDELAQRLFVLGVALYEAERLLGTNDPVARERAHAAFASARRRSPAREITEWSDGRVLSDEVRAAFDRSETTPAPVLLSATPPTRTFRIDGGPPVAAVLIDRGFHIVQVGELRALVYLPRDAEVLLPPQRLAEVVSLSPASVTAMLGRHDIAAASGAHLWWVQDGQWQHLGPSRRPLRLGVGAALAGGGLALLVEGAITTAHRDAQLAGFGLDSVEQQLEREKAQAQTRAVVGGVVAGLGVLTFTVDLPLSHRHRKRRAAVLARLNGDG